VPPRESSANVGHCLDDPRSESTPTHFRYFSAAGETQNTIEHTAVQASQDERPSDSMSVCLHAKRFATVPLSFKISFETQSARSGKIEKKEKPA